MLKSTVLKQLKRYGKTFGLSVIAPMVFSSIVLSTPSYASNIAIPDLGTAGALGISIQKEKDIGQLFMRTARANLNVVDDPVMSEYITSLGNRLLSKADNVAFPFNFFLVQDPNLNASAFLGGQVAINTGLFTYAQTEDEFASVLAHEITHVTQRHIARYIESMVSAGQLSIASVIGSVIAAIINPALGAAALTTTIGAQAQANINFTRDNEYEADRLGINLLYNAGLNPKGMVDLFKRLDSMQGNVNPAFVMLIDHPLSQIRIAEAQNRVNQLPARKNSTNPDYDFARARVAVRYSNADLKEMKAALEHNYQHYSSNYVNYGLALIAFENKDLSAARSYLHKLPASLQDDLFVIDLYSDIDIKDNKPEAAVNRLLSEVRRYPNNQVIVANLAVAYNESNQATKAKKILEDYLKKKPNDVLVSGILADTYGKLKDKCNALQMRGEVFAQMAAYTQAVSMYNQALENCSNYLTQERIKARLGQIITQRADDEALMRGG